MLDDLRNSSSFIEEEEAPIEQEEAVQYRPARRRQKETFLGMTAQQRFLISLMVFFMVFILGILALVATGAFTLPF